MITCHDTAALWPSTAQLHDWRYRMAQAVVGIWAGLMQQGVQDTSSPRGGWTLQTETIAALEAYCSQVLAKDAANRKASKKHSSASKPSQVLQIVSKGFG